MNIKSLLIGSAAALAAVSGAQAADAIVAAEPEPLEYVRVCDAFGTGFFYIPGTETCLKIGGYVRFQTDFKRNTGNVGSSTLGTNNGGRSDWDSFTRAQLDIDARSETELGALRGFISLQGNADQGNSRGVNVDQVFIELGGLKVGYFTNWWDDGLAGETDKLATLDKANAVRYTFTNDNFYAGIAVEELEGNTIYSGSFQNDRNGLGIDAIVGASLGGVKFNLLGGYDTEAEEGAIRAILQAPVGPGSLELAAIWSSDPNAYYDRAEWTVAVAYALQATEKLKITPGFQYFSDYSFINNNDAWRAGVTLDYKIVKNLDAKVSVQYEDRDVWTDGAWEGFFRLQRTF